RSPLATLRSSCANVIGICRGLSPVQRFANRRLAVLATPALMVCDPTPARFRGYFLVNASSEALPLEPGGAFLCHLTAAPPIVGTEVVANCGLDCLQSRRPHTPAHAALSPALPGRGSFCQGTSRAM